MILIPPSPELQHYCAECFAKNTLISIETTESNVINGIITDVTRRGIKIIRAWLKNRVPCSFFYQSMQKVYLIRFDDILREPQLDRTNDYFPAMYDWIYKKRIENFLTSESAFVREWAKQEMSFETLLTHHSSIVRTWAKQEINSQNIP